MVSPSSPTSAAMASLSPITVTPAFVLLFALTPAAAAERPTSFAGLRPMPDDNSQAYLGGMESVQRHLSGETPSRTGRLQRTAVGRLSLHGAGGDFTHADLHLIVHGCGAALWEVSVFGSLQPFDVAKWIAVLDLESRDSVVRVIWNIIAGGLKDPSKMPEIYLPLVVLSFHDGTMTNIIARHADDLVRLLHRDESGERFKASFVKTELAADLCRSEEGLWLLARNGAIDVHAHSNDREAFAFSLGMLPLLLTLEVLCLDRAVLRSFLDRFDQRAYGTLDDLIGLRREIFDNLQEYYGTISKRHAYTADSLKRGEALFGIDDLFEAVVDRLEGLTFEITTRNQQSVNRLGLWLTTSFGAIETGSVAASVATWYYTNNWIAVLAWTVGVTFVTALIIASLLRWTMKSK